MVVFQLFPVQEAKSVWNTWESVLSSGDVGVDVDSAEVGFGSMGVEDVFFLMCVIAMLTLDLICPAMSLSCVSDITIFVR